MRAYNDLTDRGVSSAAQDDKTVLHGSCSLVQQLQQAGMFEHCAATMLTAAQLLQADGGTTVAAMRSAAAPTAQNAGAQGSGSSNDGSSGTQTSSSSGAQSRSSTSAMGGSSQLSYTSLTALKLACRLLPLQEVNSEGWCRMLEATAELTVAVVGFFEGVTQGARSGDLLDPRLPEVTGSTIFYLMQLLRDSKNRQLLQSSVVSSAVSLAVLLVDTQSLLPVKVQQGYAASTLSGSSSSGGGGRGLLKVLVHMQLSEAGQRHVLRAWKAAQQLQAQLQQPLLHALCVSMRAVGWMAGNISVAHDDVVNTTCAVDTLLRRSGRFMQLDDGLQQEGFPPQQLGSVMQQQAMPALLQQLPHRLLLVQLLLIALQRRHQQQERTPAAMAAWLVNCRSIVLTALNAVGCARNNWAAQCTMWAEASPQLAAEAREQGGEQLKVIIGSWMSSAMPILLKIMAALLKEAGGVAAAAAAAAASSCCCCCCCSTLSGCEQQQQQQQQLHAAAAAAAAAPL